MRGIVHTRKRLLQRLANIIERRFPDVRECTLEGGGIQETRPEYLVAYRRCFVYEHADGARAVLLLTPGAKTRLAALRTQIQARRAAGTATQEEADIDDLPGEEDLDVTWGELTPPT